MIKTIRPLLLFLAFFIHLTTLAQGSQSVEMADQFRSDGKIYVVIVVIGVLLAGFFIYLFVMDKKLSKLEKSIKEKEH